MTKTYKNPPLKEAVCEFRFDLRSIITELQGQAFYEKIKDVFPIEKTGRLHNIEVQLNAGKDKEEKGISQKFHEFKIYLSQNEKCMVQVDGGRISIHQLHPYISWAEFLPLIQKIFNSYIECVAPTGIVRIGLRYVNEITLLTENFRHEDSFNISLVLPDIIEKTKKTMFIVSISEQEEGKDAIKIQFGEKTPNQTQEQLGRTFIFDLDYFLLVPHTITFGDVGRWLETAHSNLEATFEDMLTESVKMSFNK